MNTPLGVPSGADRRRSELAVSSGALVPNDEDSAVRQCQAAYRSLFGRHGPGQRCSRGPFAVDAAHYPRSLAVGAARHRPPRAPDRKALHWKSGWLFVSSSGRWLLAAGSRLGRGYDA